MKKQRSLDEFVVKIDKNAIQKTTAKKTSNNGRPIPIQPNNKRKHVADDGSQTMYN